MTRPADIAVLCACVAAGAFLGGMTLGETSTRQQIATRCAPQPGEGPLIAVHQQRDGVICVFDQSPQPGYGRSLRVRKAVRS